MLLKMISILVLVFSGTASRAQLTTVYAEGGGGKDIDWGSIKKQIEAEAEEGDVPFFYNDCLMEFTVTKASSVLPPQGKKDYDVQNLSDEDPTTAWIPNSKHRGIGAYFEISSRSLNVIYNGYQSNPIVWKDNARVKKLKVYQDDNPLCFLVLTDEMGAQRFELPGETAYADEPKSMFRFEIVDVYEGAKYEDVAVAEIAWSGCCFAGNTMIATESSMLPVSELSQGQWITTLDLETGATKEAKVLRAAHQKHLTLLVVSTPTRSIKITPDHPLYVKGHGFISFNRLKKLAHVEHYADLVGTAELLVWNAERGKQEYEILSAIGIEKAAVVTYTVRKLTEGTVFIANGFVTSTY